MSALFKPFAGAAFGLAVAFVGASVAKADPLILNPEATNGGAGALSLVDPTFSTTNAHVFTTSDLLVYSAVGNNSGGPVYSSENGSLQLNDWGAGQHHGLAPVADSGNYDVWATFSITGFGSWTGAPGCTGAACNNYQLTDPTTFTISLYADPQTTSNPLTYSQATQTSSGITDSATPALLGTLVLTDASGGPPTATFACTGQCSGNALNITDAILHLTPSAGYAGLGGFFQNVDAVGFNLQITGSTNGQGFETQTFAGAAPGDTCPATDPNGHTVTACSDIQVLSTASNPLQGSGTLTFDVPEPASLGLLGGALVGLGGLARRRRRRQG